LSTANYILPSSRIISYHLLQHLSRGFYFFNKIYFLSPNKKRSCFGTGSFKVMLIIYFFTILISSI